MTPSPACEMKRVTTVPCSGVAPSVKPTPLRRGSTRGCRAHNSAQCTLGRWRPRASSRSSAGTKGTGVSASASRGESSPKTSKSDDGFAGKVRSPLTARATPLVANNPPLSFCGGFHPASAEPATSRTALVVVGGRCEHGVVSHLKAGRAQNQCLHHAAHERMRSRQTSSLFQST